MALLKDIAGYEGLYQVSDDGKVISLARAVPNGKKVLHRKQAVMTPRLRGKNGLMYEAVALRKDGTSKTYSVHRLVAEAFLPNPDNLSEVNHKDENPLNNRVENLEWCTHQYNIDYSKSKPVMQIDGETVIATFKSIKEAGRQTGIKRTGINNVLTGWAKTAGGYKWAYCD
jgi:hypothetical protein